MIEEAADFIPIWMMLSAFAGFMVGEALGGQARVRKYLEQANAELRDQLREAQTRRIKPATHARSAARRHQRHPQAHFVAVTKGLRKTRPLNPTK